MGRSTATGLELSATWAVVIIQVSLLPHLLLLLISKRLGQVQEGYDVGLKQYARIFWLAVPLVVLLALVGFGVVPSSFVMPVGRGSAATCLISLLGIPVWFWQVGPRRADLWVALDPLPSAWRSSRG